MAETFDPVPQRDPLLEGDDKPISRTWFIWLSAFVALVQANAKLLKIVSLVAQAASIGLTTLTSGSAGLYRVSWVLRITRPATVSSSLTVAIGYSDQAIVCSQSGAAVTGNTATTVQSGEVIVQSDAASPVTYSTTYASVGGTTMQYKLSVVCEYLGTA